MAFESVEVSSLQNAIITCKNSINHKSSDELLNNISNMNVWQSSSQKNLKNSLDKLVNERYLDLEKKLNSYIPIVGYITEYKKLEEENKNLEIQYSNLYRRLWYEEEYEKNTIINGKEVKEICKRNVKDYAVEGQMNEIKRKIEENKKRMIELERIVANSI